MAFCEKCGAQIDDNAAVCPSCGAQQTQKNNTYVNTNPNLNNAAGADYTAQFNPNDIQQNKGLSVLAYIGILFLVPLLAAPNSPYARFHTNQGLVLFIFDVAIGIVAGIFNIIPFVGWIFGTLLSIAVLVFVIIGIVNAASGKAKELPLIGRIKILK